MHPLKTITTPSSREGGKLALHLSEQGSNEGCGIVILHSCTIVQLTSQRRAINPTEVKQVDYRPTSSAPPQSEEVHHGQGLEFQDLRPVLCSTRRAG